MQSKLNRVNRLSGKRFFGGHKIIHFGQEGRAGLARGVDILAKAVSVTLG